MFDDVHSSTPSLLDLFSYDKLLTISMLNEVGSPCCATTPMC